MAFFPNSKNLLIEGGTFTNVINNRKGPSVLEKLAEAAAHTALHNAPARTDTSRCLPGTRIKASRRLKRWARRTSRKARAIFWLNGGAGAGKSALMQTIAECLVAEGLILGCFFFYRMDATRNRAGALVATLAYQLVQHFPLLKTFLDPLFDDDPMIFQKSFQHQFEHLLVKPLRHLVQEGLLTGASQSRRVFIIDGLDECIDRAEQRAIIRAVSTLHYLPVKFLIASRIEVDISTAFETHAASHRLLESMSLSDDVDANRDIRQFLEDQFQTIRGDHPFRDIIPPDWPSDDQVSALVHKSSSHFVFAATAMRYISLPTESPVHALDVVLGLERTRTAESPFSEIDALYRHILESAAHRDKVLEIIRFCIFYRGEPTIWVLSYYALGCSCDDIYIFLADMTPLINVCGDENDPRPSERKVEILHASLWDFLHDQQRSGFLYIDEDVLFTNALRQYFDVMTSIIKDKDYLQSLYSQSSLELTGFFLVNTIGGAIIDTGGVCGPVYDVLRQHNIRVFHDLSHFLQGHSFDFAEEIVITIEDANFRDSGKLLTQYLDDYAAIQEPYILEEIDPIGPAILPLLYTGFSRRLLQIIVERVLSHHWPLSLMVDTLIHKLRTPTFPLTRHIYGAAKGAAQGAEAILEYFTTFAAFRARTGRRPESSSVLWEPPHKTWLRSHKSGTRVAIGSPVLARVFHDRCVVIKLESWRGKYGPGSQISAERYLRRVVEALPTVYTGTDYEKLLPQEQNALKYPAYGFSGFFSFHDYHLLKALIWLLDRAGFSDKLLYHSNRLTPRWTYLRWPKLSQRLRRSLDDYRVRVTNERIQELSERILAGDRDALIEKTRLLEVDALE